MSPEFELNLVIAAVVLLASATIIRAWEYPGARRGQSLTYGCLGSAAAFLGLAIWGRWIRESQGPFLTLYDILLSNSFSLAALFLVVAWRVPSVRAASVLASPILLMLAAWAVVVPAQAVPLPPTFDNPWLWLHVISGKLFLGVYLACVSTAGLLIIQRHKGGRDGAVLPTDVGAADRAVWALLFLAFVFHSCMLLSGSVWAHGAWGRYWSWDTLETSTLVTWLALGGILHARSTFRNLPEIAGYWLVIAVFVLAFLTFFGVPLLSSAPHKGFV